MYDKTDPSLLCGVEVYSGDEPVSFLKSPCNQGTNGININFVFHTSSPLS